MTTAWLIPHEWHNSSHVKHSNITCCSKLGEFRSTSVQEQLTWSLALSQKQLIIQSLDFSRKRAEYSPPCHSTNCRAHGLSLNVSLLKQIPLLVPTWGGGIIPLQQLSTKILLTNFLPSLLNTSWMSNSPYPEVLKRWL